MSTNLELRVQETAIPQYGHALNSEHTFTGQNHSKQSVNAAVRLTNSFYSPYIFVLLFSIGPSFSAGPAKREARSTAARGTLAPFSLCTLRISPLDCRRNHPFSSPVRICKAASRAICSCGVSAGQNGFFVRYNIYSPYVPSKH